MDKTLPLLIVGAGVLFAVYALSANAEVDTSDDWSDDSPIDPTLITDTSSGQDPGSVNDWLNLTTNAPSYSDLSSSGDASDTDSLQAPAPGIDFGILSDLGAAVSGWKSDEYPNYAAAIAAAEAQYGIPTDLVARVLYQESRFKDSVISGFERSSTGAIGIGQFEPPTAAQYGLTLVPSTYNGKATQTYDPFASILATAHYLHNLYNEFGSWTLAIMGYNWGDGNLRKWINAGSNPATVAPQTAQYVAQITSDVPVA